MNSLHKRLHDVEEGIIALLLVTTTLIVTAEVVMRFAFNSGISWAQEVTLHLSAWMVLFGASYGVRVGAHIGVDALVRIMPTGLRRMAGLIGVLLCLLYCGLFLYGSWVYLAKMFAINIELHDVPVKKWMAHSVLFIGYVMLVYRFIELGISILRGKTDGFELADEAKDAMRLSEPGHHEADEEAGR